MMPDWLAGLTIGDMTATIVGVSAIVVAWKPVRKFMKFLDTVSADWNGVPARLDAAGETVTKAIPGIPAKLELIRHELFPNSGLSLRDQTNRIETTLTEHIAETATRREKADALTRTVTEDIAPVARRLGELHPEP